MTNSSFVGLVVLVSTAAPFALSFIPNRRCTSIPTRRARATAQSAAVDAIASTKRRDPKDVVSLFDGYAQTFETALNELKYCTPAEIGKVTATRVDEFRKGCPYQSALDAGCGTGLSGPFLRPLIEGPLVGVDLSPKMLELAAELLIDDGPEPVAKDRMRRCDEAARSALGDPPRLFDGIFEADLLNLDEARAIKGFGQEVTDILPTFELVISADVLCYFGEMEGVLKALAKKTAPGGDLIFTCETMTEGDYNWVKQSSNRYAHNKEYVARVAEGVGLVTVEQLSFSPRLEAGEEVPGTLHVFHKPA